MVAELTIEAVQRRFRESWARRQAWEGLWRDCYTFALPHRGSGFGSEFAPGRNVPERVFDSTAIEGVDQLASSLLAELAPPRSQWFSLVPGRDLGMLEAGPAAEVLDRITATVHAHLERSNFSVELHQAFLDLVTIGNATLLVEEAPVGDLSALRFAAVPMAEMSFEAGPDGRIDGHFRRSVVTPAGLASRFPDAGAEVGARAREGARSAQPLDLVEAVLASFPGGAHYIAWLENQGDAPVVLAHCQFESSPFLSFRWLKGAAEVYGRSPVMAALPDIKTVNKVVELVLKNASIAVTGIWQADDDGVLNPANIRLVPGTIIPKAVGSSGLTPLQTPGRFDVSTLMLDDLRGRIRRTLMVDRLGPSNGPRMTATEVLERSQETTRLLGATFGRLQTELVTPLLLRTVSILRRRGEIPDLRVDGREVDIAFKSPLARAQARADVQDTLMWLEVAEKLGPEGRRAVDLTAAAKWLGHRLGVPGQLIRDDQPSDALMEKIGLLDALTAGAETGDD